LFEKAKETLKLYFGYSDFRKEQEEIIKEVLLRRDMVVIMATGKGKSICYQLPALLFPGVTIVISPLIALMKDQVDKIVSRGIGATFINSSLEKEEIKERLEKLKKGKYKLLYIAPERIRSKTFLEILSGIKVSLFAIDEAHCISEWGHSFRPDYLEIKSLIRHSGNPQVMALTATATPAVRRDIIKNLELKKPVIKIFDSDRENFTYRVKKIRRTSEKDEFLWDFLCEEPGRGLIYCGTRNEVENLSKKLETWGIKAEGYHGGLSDKERERIQEEFMDNKFEVVVATNAFGMGVDKGDIRFVIHYTIPPSIESYYQEAGRGGRDGKSAQSIILFKPSDIYFRKNMININYPEGEKIKKIFSFLCSKGKEVVSIIPSETGKKLFPRDKNTSTVDSSLKILEQYGYIETKKAETSAGNVNKIDVKIKEESWGLNFSYIEKLKEREEEKLEYIIRYCKTGDCRRNFILSYFGEKRKETGCNSCDDCRRNVIVL